MLSAALAALNAVCCTGCLKCCMLHRQHVLLYQTLCSSNVPLLNLVAVVWWSVFGL